MQIPWISNSAVLTRCDLSPSMIFVEKSCVLDSRRILFFTEACPTEFATIDYYFVLVVISKIMVSLHFLFQLPIIMVVAFSMCIICLLMAGKYAVTYVSWNIKLFLFLPYLETLGAYSYLCTLAVSGLYGMLGIELTLAPCREHTYLLYRLSNLINVIMLNIYELCSLHLVFL